MAATAQTNAITLRGSTDIVSEFFGFGINSILYQRGIYPAESFKRVQEYGLPMLVTDDEKLKEYLRCVLDQLKVRPFSISATFVQVVYYIIDWLYQKTVSRLVLVISAADEPDEVIERWTFNIECDKETSEDSKPKEKPLKTIQKEIRDVIKQITATITFLPLLDRPCAFDLLIYTNKDQDIPNNWEESGPKFITNSEEVRLKSFSTIVHKIDTMVAYKSE